MTVESLETDPRSPRRRWLVTGVAVAVSILVAGLVLLRQPDVAIDQSIDVTVPEVFAAWVVARNAGGHDRLLELTSSNVLTQDGAEHSRARVRYEAAVGVLLSVRDCASDLGSDSASYDCVYDVSNPMFEVLGLAKETGRLAVEIDQNRVVGLVVTREPVDQESEAFSAFSSWLSGERPDLMNVLFGEEAWVQAASDDVLARKSDELLDSAIEFVSLSPAGQQAVFSGEVINAAQTWFNSLGLVRFDRQLWQARLDEACGVGGGVGVWDHTVARRLASEYAEQDHSALEIDRVVDHDQAAQALWVMARNFCPEQFSDAAIEAGPPRP